MNTMLYISCIRFSIELLISESVFLIGKSKREYFGIRLPVALLGYFGAASGFYLLLHSIPGDFLLVRILFWTGLFVLSMCAIYAVFDFTVSEVLFAGIGGYATEHITFCIVKIIQYTTNTYADQIGSFWENIIYRLLAYILIAAVVYFLVIRKNRGEGEIKEHDLKIILLSFTILIVAIVLSVFTDADFVLVGRSILRNVIAPMYSMICCILVIVMEFYVSLDNRLRTENQNMEQLLHLSRIQQKSSKEAIDIINMKCHDLKHQMKVLMTMENSEERSEYIREMREAVNIYDATFHTGCEALDYVLREKMLLCEEYQIALSCMADGKAINFMKSADIYAMMGNALDNAIESAMKEPEEKRLLSLHISTYAHMVHVHVENTCHREIIFQNGLPVTDKEDKNVHGFGVRSIAYIARKYDGEFMMRQRDGKFILDVLFQEK